MPSPETSLRLLLVEDSETARRVIRAAVADAAAELELIEAPDLASGLKLLTSERFDCALVDFRLPDGTGLDLLATLRARGGIPTPVVILTGLNDEAVALQTIQAGAQDYLTKAKLDGNLLLRSVRYAIERKRAEDWRLQLQQVDRMAALGTLSAGVAHEINNPLAYILTNLSYLGDELPKLAPSPGSPEWASARGKLDELLSVIDETRQGAQRVQTIVQDLRAYTRSAETEAAGPLQVEAVLEAAITMAWHEIRHRARLVKEYEPAAAVRANQVRLGQVFLNLLINAAQAIPEGHAGNNTIWLSISTDERGWVKAGIADTGRGMPPEVLSHIFDPFFTTKPVGGGSGLGLFVCDGLVRAMGGELSVESSVGEGSRFTVLLPPWREDASRPTTPASSKPVAAAPRTGKRARLLVVDDEPLVLSALGRVLGREHEVVTAASGAEAIARLEKGEQFDLIFSDLMMPTMSGMELYSELCRVAPQLAASMIFLTGGAFTPAAREFLERIPNRRIEKPFEGGALRALVREILG